MPRLLEQILALAILLLLSPLLIAVCVALRFTGEREVLYVQQRMGKRGRPFRLYKFATMVKGSSSMAGGMITRRNDPRVLPLGRLLRKTKINELPQLLNVLKGDMSLVGPRPQVPRHHEMYDAETQAALATVSPGLTGIGSIVFRNEESLLHEIGSHANDFYRDSIAPYKGALEMWYIHHKSAGLDLWLLLVTAVAVAVPSGNLFALLPATLPSPPKELIPFLGLSPGPNGSAPAEDHQAS